MTGERSAIPPLQAPVLALSVLLCAGVAAPASAHTGETSRTAQTGDAVRHVVQELTRAARHLSRQQRQHPASINHRTVRHDTPVEQTTAPAFHTTLHLPPGIADARTRANRPPPPLA